MRTSAISDTVCQVTQGSEGWWAEDDYAQWMKRELDARDWKRKDLVAAIAEIAPAKTVGGIDAFVRRASHGYDIKRQNRALIARVLGPPPAEEMASLSLALLHSRLQELEVKIGNTDEIVLAHDERLAILESGRQVAEAASKGPRKSAP